MKKLLFLVVISLSVAILSWGFIEKEPEDCSFNTIKADSLIYQKWILIKLNGKDDVKEKAGEKLPYLKFKLKEVSGYNGCNWANGDALITEDEITFSNMTITKMACGISSFSLYEQEIEDLFFYKKPFKYKIETGILTIYKKEKEVMVLEIAN